MKRLPTGTMVRAVGCGFDILPRPKAGDSSYSRPVKGGKQLRFAVHGPGYPVASPRSHGVPRRDVPGRVHVSMDLEAAGAAPEPRLALSGFRVAVPAARAGLRGVRGADFLDPSGCLVLQAAHQQPPCGPHDLAVEPGLLADIPAWVLSRAFRGPGHVPDLQ